MTIGPRSYFDEKMLEVLILRGNLHFFEIASSDKNTGISDYRDGAQQIVDSVYIFLNSLFSILNDPYLLFEYHFVQIRLIKYVGRYETY